jgi:hypothetical protein
MLYCGKIPIGGGNFGEVEWWGDGGMGVSLRAVIGHLSLGIGEGMGA